MADKQPHRYKRMALKDMDPRARERERKRRAAEKKRKAAAKATAKRDHSAAWLKARAATRRAKNQTKALLEGHAKALRKRELQKRVPVNLKTFHFVNGERYGPGVSWVPKGVLLAVLETDRRALEAEDALFTQRSHIITSSGRGRGVRTVQVATPSFDQLWAGENPPIFDTVSGKGVRNVGQGPKF